MSLAHGQVEHRPIYAQSLGHVKPRIGQQISMHIEHYWHDFPLSSDHVHHCGHRCIDLDGVYPLQVHLVFHDSLDPWQQVLDVSPCPQQGCQLLKFIF